MKHNVVRSVLTILLAVAFLLWVVLVPFSTPMVMEYGDSRLLSNVYVSHLLITSLTLSWLWLYASKDERLIESSADLDTLRRHSTQAWVIRAVFVLSIVMSFFNVGYARWSLLLLLLAQLGRSLRL